VRMKRSKLLATHEKVILKPRYRNVLMLTALAWFDVFLRTPNCSSAWFPMNTSRFTASLILIWMAAQCRAESSAMILNTPTYRIVVREECEEGVVGCDKVTYQGTHKKTGKSISLKGTSVMAMCNDGVMPCHLQYYRFSNAAYCYIVTPDGHLIVERNKQRLLEEEGEWSY